MQNIFPIHSEVLLLGYSNQTVKIIKILNKKYNVIPTLFAPNRPIGLSCLFIRYTFCKQELPNNDYYTVHTILDIAKSFPGEHPALMPCTSHFQNIVYKYAFRFENEYILYSLEDCHNLLNLLV